MRICRDAYSLACVLLCAVQFQAQSDTAGSLAANPGRPTVSTPATLTPVGYLQFENGVLYAASSAEFTRQLGVNQVTKLAVASRLQLLLSSEPYTHTNGVAGDINPENRPGGLAAGFQAVLLPGKALRPTLSASYFRTLYSGSAADIDIGSFQQSAVVLVSEDLGAFHFDMNGIFNEQLGDSIRRGQFGQTLSVSHPLGPLIAAGELWHFTQPLTGGNAVGNLWALSDAVRKNLVIDAGFNRGLTSSSTRWEGFAGFTYLLPHRLWPVRK